MPRLILTLLIAMAALGAEDAWTKVQKLKTGTEIRVYKRGSKQPVKGKLEQATDDAVIVTTKKEQTGIQRDEVDRIEARPEETGSRSGAKNNYNPKLPIGGPHGGDVQDPTKDAGAETNARNDYEVVYARPK